MPNGLFAEIHRRAGDKKGSMDDSVDQNVCLVSLSQYEKDIF